MKKKDLQKPVTLEVLSQFTEEVILPGVEKIMDNKLDDQMKCIKRLLQLKKI